MPAKKKGRFTHGPEWEQWNRFKGKHVTVAWRNEPDVIYGKLVWVDVYTLGIMLGPDEEPSIIYKDPRMMVGLTPDAVISGEWVGHFR